MAAGGRPENEELNLLYINESLKFKEVLIVGREIVLPPRSHVIYETISKNCSNLTTKVKNANAIQHLFRRKIRDLKALLIGDDLGNEISVTSTEEASTDDENDSDRKDDDNCGEIYKTSIAVNIWQTIFPLKPVYSGIKKRRVPAFGWFNKIDEIFVLTTKSKCCLKYKYKNLSIFAEGTCKECKAIVQFKINSNELDNDKSTHPLEIKFLTVSDPNKHSGKAKRQIRGEKRNQVGLMMMNGKTPLEQQSDMCRNNQGFLIPQVPNLNVLQKIKSDFNKKKRLAEDPFTALNVITNSRKYAHSIPLYQVQDGNKIVIYILTELQKQVLKNVKNAVLCIDATGVKVIPPLAKLNSTNEVKQKVPVVFLYGMTVTTKTATIAAGFLISQSHNTKTVKGWLTHHHDNTNMGILQINTDGSKTLMTVVCEVYIGSSLNVYLDNCYKILAGEKVDIKIFLRLDRAHFVKLIIHWSVWKKAQRNSKTFYQKVLCVLVQEECFETLKKIAKNILLIAHSEYHTQQVQAALVLLKHYIKNGDLFEDLVDVDIGDDDETTHEEDVEEELKLNYSGSNWFKRILEEAEEIVETFNTSTEAVNENAGNVPSPYYLPDLDKDLKRIMEMVPLWTNILREFRHDLLLVATSAYIESLFNILKNNVFRSICGRIRIDEYVTILLDYIESNCLRFRDMVEINDDEQKPSISMNEELKDGPEETIVQERIVESDPEPLDAYTANTIFDPNGRLEENWRGLNPPEKASKKRGRGLIEPDPDYTNFEVKRGRVE